MEYSGGMDMAREVKKKGVRLNPTRILILLLVLWVGFSFGKNAVANYRLKQEIRALEKRIAVLEMRREDLEREIEQWLSPENVERVAREQLGLVKPGEVVYRLSEPADDDPTWDVEKR